MSYWVENGLDRSLLELGVRIEEGREACMALAWGKRAKRRAYGLQAAWTFFVPSKSVFCVLILTMIVHKTAVLLDCFIKTKHAAK